MHRYEKKIKNQYKRMKGCRCIYKITHIKTNRSYIGQTVNHKARWKTHKEQLASNKHHNHVLQEIFNQTRDFKDLSFSIIKKCKGTDDLDKLEYDFWKMEKDPINDNPLSTRSSTLTINKNIKTGKVVLRKTNIEEADATGCKRQDIPQTVEGSLLQKEANKAVTVTETVAQTNS